MFINSYRGGWFCLNLERIRICLRSTRICYLLLLPSRNSFSKDVFVSQNHTLMHVSAHLLLFFRWLLCHQTRSALTKVRKAIDAHSLIPKNLIAYKIFSCTAPQDFLQTLVVTDLRGWINVCCMELECTEDKLSRRAINLESIRGLLSHHLTIM